MLWFYIFFISLIILLLLIPQARLRSLWPTALLGLVKGLIVDSKFIELKAYSFLYGNPTLLGLPTFYWLSGAIYIPFVIYFLPDRKKLRIPYTLACSLALLVVEHIALYFGYFFRYNWSDIDSILLILIVNASSISLASWLGIAVYKKSSL